MDTMSLSSREHTAQHSVNVNAQGVLYDKGACHRYCDSMVQVVLASARVVQDLGETESDMPHSYRGPEYSAVVCVCGR